MPAAVRVEHSPVIADEYSEIFERDGLGKLGDVYIYLPSSFKDQDGIGGPPPEDILALDVSLSVGEYSDEDPVWRINLADILDDGIFEWLGGERDYAMKICKALIDLAYRIELKTRGETN